MRTRRRTRSLATPGKGLTAAPCAAAAGSGRAGSEMDGRVRITAAIPTYRREEVLLDTLRALFNLDPPADEILVLDQTERHDRATAQQLQAWQNAGRIRWITLAPPSIPHAMNQGLLAARCEVVLFLDDDIRPE